MGTASRYAWLNRFVIDELMRQAWSKTVGVPSWSLLVDVPHNVISQEHGKNVHRKGATPAHTGQLGVIPGSMGDASYLVVGCGNPDWLWSCSHGAGRQVKRQTMRSAQATHGNWTCLTTNEARKIEEHPSAYKPIGPVIDSQVEQGLIEGLVELKPLWTFKT
jgi:tRNA-splicing ligase RtcB